MIDMRALSGAAAGTDGDEARAAPSLTVTPDMIRGPASCSLGEDDSGGADPLRPRKGSGTPGHGTPSKYYFDGNPARGDGDGVHKESNQTRCDQPAIVALPSTAFDPADPFPGARVIIHDRKFRLLHDDGTIGPVPFKLSRKASFAAAELAAEYQLGKSA